MDAHQLRLGFDSQPGPEYRAFVPVICAAMARASPLVRVSSCPGNFSGAARFADALFCVARYRPRASSSMNGSISAAMAAR